MKVATFIVFLFIGYVSSADDPFCSICLPNGVNCISEREYVICRGKEPSVNGTVHTCKPTQVCTDEAEVCLEKEQQDENGQTIIINGKCSKDAPPTVDDGKLGDCELCVAKYAFACIGPTTYALCMGGVGKGKFNSDVTEECPENYVCNTVTKDSYDSATLQNPYYPCIPKCAVSITYFGNRVHIILLF